MVMSLGHCHPRLVEAVMLAPPLIVDEADIDEILEKLEDAVRNLNASPRAETA